MSCSRCGTTAAGATTGRPRSWLTLFDDYRAQTAKLDAHDKQVTAELAALVKASGSTRGELCGLSTVLVAELQFEVGDLRWFTIGGFAHFNASAPLAASTAEGPGKPVRHRYNRGVNRTLHLMAVTQLRGEPRAQTLYETRAHAHTNKKAPPDPQTPPLRRHLPPHDPRPRTTRRRSSPPRCLTLATRGTHMPRTRLAGPRIASRGVRGHQLCEM